MFENNRFAVGVNYWASHAGLFMWRRWDEDRVREDLRLLAEHRFHFLRVFPLWPDFQPITMLRGQNGVPKEVRFQECPLGDDDLGQAGIDPVMMNRFDSLVAIASRHGLRLNVALITGWMSGRLFVPPALEGKNVLSDPEALMWQLRFVRAFVSRYAANRTICGWDLGNEANCMADVDRATAWVWTTTIVDAIRLADPNATVVSGMDDLSIDGAWRVRDQAESVDVLTTHPYPEFVPHCSLDTATSYRTLAHGTAASTLYADIGGRPVLCQETNLLGPMLAAPDETAAFARATTLSLWSHGVVGTSWWTAFDQAHVSGAPYEWNALERELGIFGGDGHPRPVARELAALSERLDDPALRDLGPHTRQALCVLTRDQDQWGVAFAAFMLSKQAGFDLRFVFEDDVPRLPERSNRTAPERETIMVPSTTGHEVMSRRSWDAIRRRVLDGATLYASLDTPYLSEFEDTFGVRVRSRSARVDSPVLSLSPAGAESLIDARRDRDRSLSRHMALPQGIDIRYRWSLEPVGAEVLMAESDGNPAWTRHDFGKGTVHLLTIPIERGAAVTPSWFDVYDTASGESPVSEPWRLLYRAIAEPAVEQRIAIGSHPGVFRTEHFRTSDGPREAVVVAINLTAYTVHDRWWINERYLPVERGAAMVSNVDWSADAFGTAGDYPHSAAVGPEEAPAVGDRYGCVVTIAPFDVVVVRLQESIQGYTVETTTENH